MRRTSSLPSRDLSSGRVAVLAGAGSHLSQGVISGFTPPGPRPGSTLSKAEIDPVSYANDLRPARRLDMRKSHAMTPPHGAPRPPQTFVRAFDRPRLLRYS